MEHRAGESLASWVWTGLASLWLAVFPLWQTGSYSCITQAKWHGMLILTAAMGVVALVCAVCCLARYRRVPFRLSPFQGLALAYFAWLGLAACLGSLHDQLNANGELAVWMGSKRYEGMATQLCYLAIFLLMSLHPPRMDWVMRLAAVTLVLFCLVVALQYAGLNPLGLFPLGLSTRTNYEFQGTIGNIDMVSGYLALVVPLLLGGYALTRRGGALWLAAGLCGVLLEACMEVQSGLICLALGAALLVLAMLRHPPCRCRGAAVLSGICFCLALRQAVAFPWLDGTADVAFAGLSPVILALLALSAALGGLAAWFRRRPGGGLPTGRVALLAAVAVLLALALLLTLPLDESWGGLWELREVLLGRSQDSFGSYRLGVWRHTLGMARENLLFGTGPDTFWYAMRNHLAQEGASLPEAFDAPHNEYLAILANDGLPALLLYLALLGALLGATWWRCRRVSRLGRGMPGYSLALLAGLMCYAVQGFFSFSICLVSPMFWAMLGMLAADAAGPDQSAA